MYSTGVLRKISTSRTAKVLALLLAAETGIQSFGPVPLMALTTGPTQPEVQGFQPVGMTDMVDPFTGDFSYNIPLLSVGDYPLNLAYQSGVTMDDEASWAGLGWNVHTGAITRQMRGLPDDFWGDEIQRNVHLRDNLTIGAKVMLGFETFGLDLDDYGVDLGAGFDVNYNTYRGVGLTSLASASVTSESGNGPLNLGLSLGAGPDGLNVSPSVSFSAKFGSSSGKAGGSATLGFGFNINSRTGLSGMTLSHSTALTGSKRVKAVVKSNDRKAVVGTVKSGSAGMTSQSSFIDMSQPTYSPQIDLPMIHSAGSGRFKFGGVAFGQDIDATITGYGSKQRLAKNQLLNPAYGYMYSEKGSGNAEALHDFNREKDGTFSKEKKNLPLTNYTYDLYSISAQGLGGSFRAYRNDAGYIYDKQANSPSESFDFGLEIGPGNLVDFGLDFSANILQSESGAWTSGNGAAQALGFRAKRPDNIRENFHFKLSGEQIPDSDPAYGNSLRNGNPVRFDLDKDAKNFEVASYNRFVESDGSKHAFSNPERANRQPRNTAVYHLTKNDVLRAYPWKAKYLSAYAKGHHIAEIVVVQPDGTRYVFGLAAYNISQREMSFNVGAGGAAAALSINAAAALVTNAGQSDIAPGTKRGIDHFYDETVTPAYAHSWMLTEILSPDYVDVKGDGPSPDDLGTYTHFKYGIEKPDGSIEPDIKRYRWRTPGMGPKTAAYMEGLRTDLTDDKGSIICGEKEVWYVHSIESKTQIAVFETENREDALGADADGYLRSASDERLKRLKSIRLYSKQEYDQAFHTPVPIKTAHFEYDYSLCPDVPNNASGGGKLTLRKVYFTYRDSKAGRFSPYVFGYRETSTVDGQPFRYAYGKADRWGCPKPDAQQPSGLSHADWPYATQDKARRDDYSSAWHLDRITLPSGGEINVKYESDDYGFVQDKAAMRMFKIDGLATSSEGNNLGNVIYPNPLSTAYRDYIILTLNDPNTTNTAQFKQKYLSGYGRGNHTNNPVKYLYYRFLINVNNGLEPPEYEYVSGYAELDLGDCGINASGKAYIKVKRVAAQLSGTTENVSPFAYSAWQFSRMNTPRKAFNQPEPTDEIMDQIVQTLASADMVSQIVQFFQGPNGRMKAQGFGSRIDPSGSRIRLLEPDKTKLGGNNRVKEISVSDAWNDMSAPEASAAYGQTFSYLDDDGNSSGVAAYEPGAGADENPWRVPSFYSGPKQILIPEERFYLEEPFGESFFPGPTVGYSKVTVKDKVYDPDVSLNTTGKTVHEFYTAYDFPSRADQTPLDIQSREQGVLAKLFSPNKRRFMTASQGYTVYLNDMHGKAKAVSMYAEGESSAFAYTRYHYKTQNGRLDNRVDIIDRDGTVRESSIGVETDFIADMREQTTYSESGSATGNLASMMFGTIGPVTVPSVFFSLTTEKTRFRSATGTKVQQQFGIQDRTETFDKGAYVETRIVAYDARTGAPLVQELNNEFKDKYYKLEYPAHWVYPGMGQASENIGYTFSYAGSGPLNQAQHSYLEPGDEVLPLRQKVYGRTGNLFQGNANMARYWVAGHEATGEKFLIDYLGQKHFPGADTEYFTVIRSGHRNQAGTPLGSVTSTQSPVTGNAPNRRILVDAAARIVATSAVEYSEHWRTSYGMPKTRYEVKIKYNAPGFGVINLLNEAIEANGSMPVNSTVALPPDADFYSLYPECVGNPYPHVYVWTNPQPCAVPAFAGHGNGGNIPVTPPSEIIQPGSRYVFNHALIYSGNQPTGPGSPQTCGDCDVFGLLDITPCVGGTAPTHWSNIAYFKNQGEMSVTVNGNVAAFINNPFWEYYYLIEAVLTDNSSAYFLSNKADCWGIDNQFEVRELPSTECYQTGDVINPYLYGILGNWRPQTEYFFMGDRNNTDAKTAENLRHDGYLPGFKAFWKAPLSPTGYWERNDPAVMMGHYENWGMKTRMSLYSPYGYNVETLNPLPAYSAATYGYLNTLPVAMAANAKQKEIGFDGFEDYYPWIPQIACQKGHFRFEDNLSDLSSDFAHTGNWSMKIPDGKSLEKTVTPTAPYASQNPRSVPYALAAEDLMNSFAPDDNYPAAGKTFVLGFWVRPQTRPHTVFDYTDITPKVQQSGNDRVVPGSLKKSKIINNWQRYELYFTVPPGTDPLTIAIENSHGQAIYVDDIRVHPFDANIKTYVYHPFDLTYMALLDENNFATLYEYDEEGKLVRLKKETERGIMTVQENRTNLYKR